MLKNLRLRTNAMLAAFVLSFLIFASNGAYAQYCEFTGGSWNEVCPRITSVKVDEVTSGNVFVKAVSDKSNTGWDQYKNWGENYTGGSEGIQLGRRYRVTVGGLTSSSGYTGFIRVWMDINANGRWSDTGEYLGSATVFPGALNYSNFTYSVSTWTVNGYFFNVPCTAPLAKTRLRVMSSYNYMGGVAISEPCVISYYDSPGWTFGKLFYGEVEDHELTILPDAPKSIPSDLAVFNGSNVKVEDNTIFKANTTYNQVWAGNSTATPFPKPSLQFNSASVGSNIEMSIQGPLPSLATVWTALASAGGSSIITVGSGGNNTTTITDSDGKTRFNLAPNFSSGAFSPSGTGDFRGTSGGEYKLVIVVSGAGCAGAANRLFTVAFNNDVAVSTITSPLNNGFPKYAKYGVGQTIKLEAIFQNVGINPVTEFWGYYKIKDALGNVVYYDSVYWDTTGSNGTIIPMLSSEKIPILLGYKKFSAPALYTMEVSVTRATGLDEESFNSLFPRPGTAAYIFEVAYDIELAASQIFAPAQGDLLIANRQYRASAEFKNNGISLGSNVPVTMDIINNATGQVVSALTGQITDIQIGRYNTKTVNFGTFSILKPGSYRAKISVRHAEDIVYGNDTMSIYFSVETGVQGTYTVGSLKETAPGFSVDRNFGTLEEFTNAIFYNGLSGSVVAELTDASYNVSTTVTNSAAWDLSSRILGLGYDAETKLFNTITIKPSSNREGIRGGVQINLSSTSGIGIKLGQSSNATSNNAFALFRTFGSQMNANNAGYISFLGGPQKALKIVNVNTSTTPLHNSAFFMAAGARNITIQNCIIDNGTPASFKLTRLPGSEYSATGDRIRYEEDYANQSPLPTGVNSATYSAGIVMRGVTGASSTLTTAPQDTIPSTNNLLDGNEISNFGVGILDLGYGPLKLAGPNKFKEFYNNNNTISNNQIYNVARAGIFLGFERNTSVMNNRIWNVGNSPAFAADAAGIQLGGNNLLVIAGYNNYEIKVDGNQISDVTSITNAFGILNDQTRRTYGLGVSTVNYPNNENTQIMNNVVWNLGTSNNTAASRFGIASMASTTTTIFNPINRGYHTNGEKIVNNTVILGDATTTSGNLIGIASIKNDNSLIFNNAISIIAPNFTVTPTTVGTAIYYNGLSLRMNGGLKSDRNIFFTGNNDSKLSNVGVFRITEVNSADSVVSQGLNGEYRTLAQLQAWFGSNENSLYGNFASDLALTMTSPAMYTVSSNLSKGSLLNNRGENLTWVASDNRGVKRGNGGERYDIGAFEFVAPLYNEDVEVTNLNGPRAYQTLTGTFADAQYIMTTAPTTVNAITRNNGRLPYSAYKMSVNIYRESAVIPGTFETTAVASNTTTIALASSESMNVNFPGFTFTPQTYADLTSNVPAYNSGIFASMAQNVTPLYKIVISGSSDEFNPNNNSEIVVRYYIKKSTLSIIGSGRNSVANEFSVVTSPADLMARLNVKAMETGFGNMGWKVSAPENHYDRFERNAWEPRAVNYTNYLTMFWADGNNETPTNFEIRDINAFLDNSKEMPKYKRNLVIASEEIIAKTKTSDNTFRTNVLRADLDPMYGATELNNTPFFGRTVAPLPGTPYFGRRITGVNVARDFSLIVNMPINANTSTTFANDMASLPEVLVGLNNSSLPGLTKDAFIYTDAAVAGKPVMGVATTSIDRNVITLGMDWRHFGDMDLITKGIVDYIAKNTDVVPVNLVNFKATKVGQKVVIDWATASEENTSKFEVEKAVVAQTGSQDFNKVAELAAAGNSQEVKFYGPVTDYDVVANTTYAYKLRMVDKNGDFDYSETRLVVMNSENGIITLADAKPNPATNSTKVEFTLSQPNSVSVTLYDINGNAVESVSNFYSTGTHFFAPDLSKIASGSYTVVLKSGDVVLTKSLNVIK